MDKKNTRQEVYKLLAANKSINYIASSLKVSRRTVERYKKEYTETLATNDKSTTPRQDKRRKEVIRAEIISGKSLREVSKLTGYSFSALKRLSSKDKLQATQREFLESLRQECIEDIKANKLDRFVLNTRLKEEIKLQEASKMTQEMLLLNEKTEQEILELGRLERLEKLELEKQIIKNKQLQEIATELERLTDSDIVKILEIIKQSKEGRDE